MNRAFTVLVTVLTLALLPLGLAMAGAPYPLGEGWAVEVPKDFDGKLRLEALGADEAILIEKLISKKKTLDGRYYMILPIPKGTDVAKFCVIIPDDVPYIIGGNIQGKSHCGAAEIFPLDAHNLNYFWIADFLVKS